MLVDDVMLRNFVGISPEYSDFAREKASCQACSIYHHYKQNAQSEGNANNPTFMFIGECYGKDEVEQIRPFIGRAGQRLRNELRKHKSIFNKGNTIITNVLSCRPLDNLFPSDSNGPHQITEEKKLVDAKGLVAYCADKWLRREIRILKPKIIVSLGSKSLEFITGESKIGNHRGTWKFLDTYRSWYMATYHPSYILRCENDSNKGHIVEDFENDISKIATSWRTVIYSDPRMNMTEEEWARERALSHPMSSFVPMPVEVMK